MFNRKRIAKLEKALQETNTKFAALNEQFDDVAAMCVKHKQELDKFRQKVSIQLANLSPQKLDL